MLFEDDIKKLRIIVYLPPVERLEGIFYVLASFKTN